MQRYNRKLPSELDFEVKEEQPCLKLKDTARK